MAYSPSSEMPMCPERQTTRPGVFGIFEMGPVFLHSLNRPLADLSGHPWPYLDAIVPFSDQKKLLIYPTQSATMRFSSMCFL